MTKLQLLNEIKSRNLKIAEILDTIKAEERELSNVEKINVDSYKEEIKEFENQLKDLEKEPVKLERSLKIGSAVESNKFSLNRYLRSVVDPTIELNEIEKEIRTSVKSEFGVKGVGLPFEFRSTLQAGTAGVGQEIVPEDKFDLIMPLRAKSVLAKAGANIYAGVKGNVSFPAMTGSTAYWKDENASSSDGNNGFTEVEFSPKRLTVYLPVSKLLLLQDTVDAENKIKQDLINAINSKLEETIFSASAGTTSRPAGLFNAASYVNGGTAVTGSSSWIKTVALETGINSANADVENMYYIIHPNTLGKFKTTAKASNTAAFIAENQLINGYKYLRTTHMPTISTGKGILFGNFADLQMLFWNNMDITVDNITGAKEGIVNYIINLYVDAGVLRSESFAKGWLS